jgi:hypothetical protein
MRAWWCLVLVFVASCSQQDLLSVIASTEDQALATRYIDLLRARRFEEIEQAADPGIRSQLHDALGQMAGALPEATPTSITLVGAQKLTNDQGLTTNLTFEYGFGEDWFLINVAWLSKDDTFTIVGFNIYDTEASLEELSKFELAGKSPTHYLFLVLAVAVPIFCIYTLVVCARTRLTGRKWPWIIFILFGVGTFSLNWTSGEWGFAPLNFLLLGAGVTAEPYMPWVVSVALPLGALLFWLRRRRLAAPASEDPR